MDATLADVEKAPLEPKVRAMLRFLAKLAIDPSSMTRDDGKALEAAGIRKRDAEEAIWVAWQFSFFTRMADSLGFTIPTDGFAMAPKVLLSPIGYR